MERFRKDFWNTPWGLIALIVLGYIAAFLIVVSLLAIPNVKKFFTQQSLTKFDMSHGTWEKSQPLWMMISGQLTLAAVGYTGTLIALWQFQRTHNQKEDQFVKSESTKEQQFKDAELEKQFVDMQNRMAETKSDTIRANAATRLAFFAQTRRVGSSPLAANEPKRIADYPFFERAGSLLATLLLFEENGRVRNTALAAIESLADFARPTAPTADTEPTIDDENGELLHKLTALLATVNRSARDSFSRVLAEYMVLAEIPPLAFTYEETTGRPLAEPEHSRLGLLNTVAPFVTGLVDADENRFANTQTLCDLMARDDYAARRITYAEIAATIKEEKEKSAAEKLTDLENSAARLITTRDALAGTLRRFPPLADPPPDLPKDGKPDDPWHDAMEKWQERQKNRVDLSGTFLAGANMREAQLAGADMSGARLAGADMGEAQLAGADMSGAQLAGANMTYAKLAGAYMFRAQLAGANMYEARLAGADMGEAQLAGADMSGARLAGADMRWAQLAGADMRWAQLAGADMSGAQLAGARLRGAKIDDKTDFTRSNWRDADWNVSDIMGDSMKEAIAALYAELDRRYP